MVALNHNAPPVVKRAGFVDDIGPLQMTAITNDSSVILPFSEIARVLMRLDHIASVIVDPGPPDDRNDSETLRSRLHGRLHSARNTTDRHREERQRLDRRRDDLCAGGSNLVSVAW